MGKGHIAESWKQGAMGKEQGAASNQSTKNANRQAQGPYDWLILSC